MKSDWEEHMDRLRQRKKDIERKLRKKGIEISVVDCRKRKPIPEFHGNSPAYGWSIEVVQHFDAEDTPEQEKLPEVIGALRGHAYIWYSCWKWHNPNPKWWEVVKGVLNRFHSEYDRDQPVWVDCEEEDEYQGKEESDAMLRLEPMLEKFEVEKVIKEVGMAKGKIDEGVKEEEDEVNEKGEDFSEYEEDTHGGEDLVVDLHFLDSDLIEMEVVE